jgi:hypothetical protein
MHEMPHQFSLKRLMASTAIIAVGCAMIGEALRQSTMEMPRHFLPLFFLWFMGGVFVGAGMLYPFRRSKLGGVLGFFIQVPTFLALAYILAF